MNKAEVIAGVSKQIVWWMGERQKKLSELRHETMSVNPFLLPLVFGIHQFKEFDELAEFLVSAHLSTGYATGFGKLIDEKILPHVFGTRKLDKAMRRTAQLSMSAFVRLTILFRQQATKRKNCCHSRLADGLFN